jgi:hypothetical protein
MLAWTGLAGTMTKDDRPEPGDHPVALMNPDHHAIGMQSFVESHGSSSGTVAERNRQHTFGPGLGAWPPEAQPGAGAIEGADRVGGGRLEAQILSNSEPGTCRAGGP